MATPDGVTSFVGFGSPGELGVAVAHLGRLAATIADVAPIQGQVTGASMSTAVPFSSQSGRTSRAHRGRRSTRSWRPSMPGQLGRRASADRGRRLQYRWILGRHSDRVDVALPDRRPARPGRPAVGLSPSITESNRVKGRSRRTGIPVAALHDRPRLLAPELGDHRRLRRCRAALAVVVRPCPWSSNSRPRPPRAATRGILGSEARRRRSPISSWPRLAAGQPASGPPAGRRPSPGWCRGGR